MRIHTSIFALLSAFVIAVTLPSCSSDDPEEGLPAPTTPGEAGFWEQPHTAFLGLAGKVSSLTSTIHADEDDEEEGLSTWTRFNAAGMITYYNPTGVVIDRMLGMEMNSYAYTYDAQGRMLQAVVTTLGGGQTIYTLTYDDTDLRYVPLPFPVGDMEFFMVRGLASLHSDQEGFSCDISADGVTYTQTEQLFRETLQTVTAYRYAPSAPFPAESSTKTLCEGEELSHDQTGYTFDSSGRLLSLSVSRSEYGEQTETETLCFHPSLPLCVQSREAATADGLLLRYDYDYEEHGWLTSVTLSAGGSTATESYLYSAPDPAGNWCEGHFSWSSRVDMSHFSGVVSVCRTLEYYPD